MRIKKSIIESIKISVGNNVYESGGIIGGIDKKEICEFYYDEGIESNMSEYVPNTNLITNRMEEWLQKGIDFLGIIHSHESNNCLSYADIDFARNIMRVNGLKNIYMMLYVKKDTQLILYKVMKDKIINEGLEVV